MALLPPLKADFYEEDFGYRSSVSEELLRKIASAVNYLNRDGVAPIGSTEMSFLPLEQFQLLRSDSWVLMDGSDITDTDYGQFLIVSGIASGVVHIPDMRGQVPIGVNNGRNDGKQNTVVPGLGLGQQMGDGVKSHNHGTNAVAITSGGQAGVGNFSNPNFGGATINHSGQSQNTVNSVGVNWYLKVWNS